MGDDQVNEYVYKFVSAGNWRSMRARGRSPLDEGTLYVARFEDDGTGTWVPLVHGQHGLTAANGFVDQGTSWSRPGWPRTSSGRRRWTGRSGRRWTRRRAPST